MNLFSKVGLVILLVLVGQLVVSEGGIVDYIKAKQKLEERYHYLSTLQQENEQLSQEIKEIQENAQLQKKLVRSMLGVMAKEEYLILFSQESHRVEKAVPQWPAL